MGKTTPKKRGRVSKYDQMRISQKLASIEGWARQGATDKEIAEMLGISPATLYRWKGQYCDFREALRTGAREANGEILNSAFRQATGFYEIQREIVKLKKVAYTEEECGIREIVRDARGNAVHEEVAEVVEYDKYFPPDARMTMFMLLNRLAEAYKQKPMAEGERDQIIEHYIPGEVAEGGENNADQLQADEKTDAVPPVPGG